MASMGGMQLDPEPALRLVRGSRMFNKQLISICKAEGLPHAGVKAELQNRISGSKFLGIASFNFR
jgi:SAP domain